MNFKSYLGGILTGVVCCLAGYVFAKNERLAGADPGSAGNGSYILATPSSSDAQLGQMVYVLKTQPEEDSQLAVYRNTGKGDLELISSRRIAFDLKLWNMGSKGLKPDEIKSKLKDEEDERKKK